MHLILKGAIYGEMWHELQGALNRDEQFIPMTDAEFDSPLPNGINQLDFIALNRDHIVFAGYDV